MAIRTVVWGENIHEQINEVVAEIYPKGMHATIAEALNADTGDFRDDRDACRSRSTACRRRGSTRPTCCSGGATRPTATVDDEIVERVAKRVWEGMGLIVLHSGHFSKIFKRLMGTPCTLHWREAGERERLWVDQPRPPDRRRASATISSSRTRRCTASPSPCPSRSRPCSSPGSRAARCSAPA